MENPIAIANYFVGKALEHGDPITPMKLLKLTYIAHGWHLGLYSEPLINEAVEAWTYGPVVRSVYHAFKKHGRDNVTSLYSFVAEDGRLITPLPEGESLPKFLDKVYDTYRAYDGLALSTLAHMEGTPWDAVVRGKRLRDNYSAPIPNRVIEEYYKHKADANRPESQLYSATGA